MVIMNCSKGRNNAIKYNGEYHLCFSHIRAPLSREKTHTKTVTYSVAKMQQLPTILKKSEKK